MIVNRGATQTALERWNERRRRIFYPKTDIDFDLDALRKRKAELSKTDFSKVADILNEEVRAIEFLPNAGTLHALFRVITPTARLILKLALEDSAVEFAIENSAISNLGRLELLTVSVRAFNVLPQGLPSPFIIFEEAPGRCLTFFEDPETQAMPEPLLFELGKSIARVHQIKAMRAGLVDATAASEQIEGLLPDWPAYVRLRLDEHLKICRTNCVIDGQEEALIQRMFVRGMDTLAKSPTRMLHGDFGHHNIFSDGQQITAIIDWEDTLAGDPIFDIAYWGTFVRDEMRARFLEGYQTVEKLPADFEYRYWLYYLRVALSKTVHRHRFGTRDRPGRPPASLRIQKALSKLTKL